MEAEQYIDTGTAARLLDVHPNTVLNMIRDGKLSAHEFDGNRGGNHGKHQLVSVASMPLNARIKYVAQIDAAHPVSNADLITYQERYGDDGMKELWKRHQTVIACKAYVAAAGWKRQTEAKEQFADECGITTRTLYRWIKAYDAEGIAGLMDKVDQSNKGRMTSMCMLSQDLAKSELYGPSRKTHSATFAALRMQAAKLDKKACQVCVHNPDSAARREFAFRGEAENYAICDQVGSGMIVPGTLSTFNRFVSTIPKDEMAYARKGKRYWEAHYMPKADRTRPERVNECWFGDHHMFDLFVVDDDGAIVRPWMTAWSDAATGCFVSYCITTNPNSGTIAETFVRAIPQKVGSEFFGIPSLIYIDNGKDYRSKKFEGEREVEHVIGRLNEKMEATGILQQLGVSVIHAQPYKAWSKVIERLFGTLEGRYVRELPGWCGNSPGARPEELTSARLRHMAEKGQLLTLQQFEKVIREQIIPQYHGERFSNAQAPIELYHALERSRDDMPSWEVLDFIKQERCTRKVYPKGVKLNNRWYWHEDMRRLVDRTVTVRYSLDDDSSVAIVDSKHFICHAPLKEQMAMLGENVKETGAILGDVMAPAANEVITVTNELLNKVKQLNPEARETVVVAALVAAGIGPVLVMVGKGIKAYNDIAKAVAAANVKMQLSAGAIGAVSIAIGLLIGVAATVVARYNKLTEAASDLAAANKKAAEDVTDAKDALNDSLVAVEANAKMAQTYTARLTELSSAQQLDNAQRAESRYLVDQLNQLYPELNVQIDEQTGKIVGGTQAINDQIVAIQNRAIAAAYEAQYTAVLQANSDLLYAAAAAETERGMITAENNSIIAERAQLEKQFQAETGLSISALASMNAMEQDALISGNKTAQSMVKRYSELGYKIDDNTVSIKALDREIDKNKTATLENEREVAIATETYKRLTGSSDALGDSMAGTADDIAKTGDAAAEADAKLKDYTDDTINNFEKLPRAVKMSAEQATANLIANNATMTQWMNDLSTLVEKGMDEGVVAKLYEMGPQFRSVVADLASGTPEAMQAFEDAMGASGDLSGKKFTTGVKNSTEEVTGKLSEASKEVDKWTSQTTADIATVVDVGIIAKLRTITPAWISVIADLIRANNTNLVAYKQSMLQSGTDSANNFYSGVKITTESKYNLYYHLGFTAGRKFVQGYNDAQQSKSPAREGIKSANNWADGVMIGTENNTDKLVAAAQAQARIPIDATKAALGSLPKIMGGALPISSPVYNSTSNTTNSSVVTRGKVEQHLHYETKPLSSYERHVEQRHASQTLAKEIG